MREVDYTPFCGCSCALIDTQINVSAGFVFRSFAFRSSLPSLNDGDRFKCLGHNFVGYSVKTNKHRQSACSPANQPNRQTAKQINIWADARNNWFPAVLSAGNKFFHFTFLLSFCFPTCLPLMSFFPWNNMHTSCSLPLIPNNLDGGVCLFWAYYGGRELLVGFVGIFRFSCLEPSQTGPYYLHSLTQMLVIYFIQFLFSIRYFWVKELSELREWDIIVSYGYWVKYLLDILFGFCSLVSLWVNYIKLPVQEAQLLETFF